MAAFAIVTLQPDGYPHTQAFHEIQILIYYSLRDLGHDVTLATNRFPEGCTAIVFGAHLLSDAIGIELPADCILFNTEQLATGDAKFSEHLLHWAKGRQIWDYSSFNIDHLKQRVPEAAGVQRLRLGFHPELQRIDRSVPRIDQFIFYGSLTPLRNEILARIQLSNRLQIAGYFGVYGWERNALLGRSRGVLNIHSSPIRILEWVRIIMLLANAIPCLALLAPETRSDDDQLSYLLPASEAAPTAELEA